MNFKFLKTILIFIIAFSAGLGAMFLMNGNSQKRMPSSSEVGTFTSAKDQEFARQASQDISQLTQEDFVIGYLKRYKKLPNYYLTKAEAKKLGWLPHQANLCEVLPGRAIGGDFFGNREGKLPKRKGLKYYEADVNYNCGRRNTDRIIYSDEGDIYLTKDHYKTFVNK